MVMKFLKAYMVDIGEFLEQTGYLPRNVEPVGESKRIRIISWTQAGKWPGWSLQNTPPTSLFHPLKRDWKYPTCGHLEIPERQNEFSQFISLSSLKQVFWQLPWAYSFCLQIQVDDLDEANDPGWRKIPHYLSGVSPNPQLDDWTLSACFNAVMENEAFISSESSCISTSRRTLRGVGSTSRRPGRAGMQRLNFIARESLILEWQ